MNYLIRQENEMGNPVKLTKQIIGYKVVTPKEVEQAFVELLDTTVTDETIKPLDKSLFERVDTLRVKAGLKRPRSLASETYRLKPAHYEHAIYVHISDITYEGKKHPFEIFFNCKNPENIMWVSTITLLLSETFREAITGNNNLTKVINNLKEVCDASGGYFATVGEKKKHVGSIVAEIGYILEDHVKECNAWNYENYSFQGETAKGAYEALRELDNLDYEEAGLVTTLESSSGDFLPIHATYKVKATNPCPDCGESMRISEGCLVCNCGYSKCG
jgi:hypothetical protein